MGKKLKLNKMSQYEVSTNTGMVSEIQYANYEFFNIRKAKKNRSPEIGAPNCWRRNFE